MIIVVGDSWSVYCAAHTTAQEFYPPSLSLPRQLETRFPGEPVFSIAEAGTSDYLQLLKLEHAACRERSWLTGVFNKFYDEPVDVVWGWSDWPRGLGWNHSTGEFKFSGSQDYYTALRKHQAQFTEQFNSVGQFRRWRFWHWGGQSQPWIDTSKLIGTHATLTQDLALELYGAPAANTGLTTMLNSGRYSTQTLFSLTPPNTARELDERTQRLQQFKHSREDVFLDHAHLRWQDYELLVDRLEAARG